MSIPNRELAASAFGGGLRSGPMNPAEATVMDSEMWRGQAREKAAAAKGLRQIFP